MVRKSCSRSQGQPPSGLRSWAMTARRRAIGSSGSADGSSVMAAPVLAGGKCGATLAVPRGGGKRSRSPEADIGVSHNVYYGKFTSAQICGLTTASRESASLSGTTADNRVDRKAGAQVFPGEQR